MTYSMPGRLLAEFIGVFALCAVGIGAIASSVALGTNIVAIALAHGLAIAVMVCAVGHVSGAHFNPAVTIAALVTKRIPLMDGAAYIVTQLVGAVAAAFAVKALYPEEWVSGTNLGVPALLDDVSVGQGIALEAIMTFFLVWVVFATAIDKDGSFRMVAGLGIGLVITMDILMGGVLTGAAMNPARAFGPALVDGTWTDHIVYWVGPIMGAVLAALAYMNVVKPRLAD